MILRIQMAEMAVLKNTAPVERCALLLLFQYTNLPYSLPVWLILLNISFLGIDHSGYLRMRNRICGMDLFIPAEID